MVREIVDSKRLGSILQKKFNASPIGLYCIAFSTHCLTFGEAVAMVKMH
jgi:hypothetical protein